MTEQQGALRADGDRCAVRFERVYDQTPEEVWAALTEPARLGRWLGTADVDLRVGGSVRFRMGDTEDETAHGAVLAVEPPRVLEYEWHYPGEGESVVRWELAPHAAGTLLVLDHTRLQRDAAAGYGAGWHAHLDQLGSHLAGDGELDWWERYRELRPSYDEQAVSLVWGESSPVREALYRGDRAAAEAAATDELDVFDAAALGRVARLRELLDADPDLVGAYSNDGFTPLHLACFSGGADALRLLAERGAPLEAVSRHPQIRVRPLGTAAFSRQLEHVRLLLEAGADANGEGDGGFVPLHTAAQNGDVEAVRLLLEHGADPSRTTPDGRTGEDLARAAGHDAVAGLLGGRRRYTIAPP